MTNPTPEQIRKRMQIDDVTISDGMVSEVDPAYYFDACEILLAALAAAEAHIKSLQIDVSGRSETTAFLQRDNDKLREQVAQTDLPQILNCLRLALVEEKITDTIWFSDHTTLFDHLEISIEALAAQQEAK